VCAIANVSQLNATSSKAAGPFHREPSRLAVRLGACFREEKSAVCHAGSKYLILAGLGPPKFFKKPLASGRVFDILCAQFRLKAGPRPRWRAAWSNQAEGQQLQTDN